MENTIYSNVEESIVGEELLSVLNQYAKDNNETVYIVNRPLLVGNDRYDYDGFVVVVPKHKLMLFKSKDVADDSLFEIYVDDFVEDLGYLAEKYGYRDVIGRPREWKQKFVNKIIDKSSDKLCFLLKENYISDVKEQRILALVISLLTGSINDIKKIGGTYPETLLEKVKKKIVLFDADQTRFIYSEIQDKKQINIQGLAGTGKTELLLHKLKELYMKESGSKIVFTCYSTILAESMLKRVPQFFDFLKVEEQIKWNERLWVIRSWGAEYNPNSGLYSYICHFYGIPFHRFSKYKNVDFDFVCKEAIDYIINLQKNNRFVPCFDYILVDESQDFPESIFNLCRLIVAKRVFSAGDVFQNIYDIKIKDDIEVDYLLNKCYRTDPKTLMFAHAIGMGLYEKPVIRWLQDKEFEACGYDLSRVEGNFILTRRPLRRFDDIDAQIKNIEIITCEYSNRTIIQHIIDIIKSIKNNHSTVLPDDIAIVFVDNDTQNSREKMYLLADLIPKAIYDEFGWKVNKGYESHNQEENLLMLTSKNYIKGLEYPFVICIAPEKIGQDVFLRNSLYMVLTRSFLTSYFIANESDGEFIEIYTEAANNIDNTGSMVLVEPSEEEKQQQENNIIIKLEKRGYTINETIDKILEEFNGVKLHERDAIKKGVCELLKNEPDIAYDFELLSNKIRALVTVYKI